MQLQKYGYSVICSISSYHTLSLITHHTLPSPTFTHHAITLLSHRPVYTLPLYTPYIPHTLPSSLICTSPIIPLHHHHAPLTSPYHHPSHLPSINHSHAPPSRHPLTPLIITTSHPPAITPSTSRSSESPTSQSVADRTTVDHASAAGFSPTQHVQTAGAPNCHTSRTRNWSGRYKS